MGDPSPGQGGRAQRERCRRGADNDRQLDVNGSAGLQAIGGPLIGRLRHVLLGNDFSGPQSGGVARLGLALDRDLGDFFAVGASLYSEAYAVRNSDTQTDWNRGSSVFLSGHLRFELGI